MPARSKAKRIRPEPRHVFQVDAAGRAVAVLEPDLVTQLRYLGRHGASPKQAARALLMRPERLAARMAETPGAKAALEEGLREYVASDLKPAERLGPKPWRGKPRVF